MPHNMSGAVAVSIVSHGHGDMVWSLIDQLLALPELSRIIVTLNVPEPVPELIDPKLMLIRNASPKGFGANHNAAFLHCDAVCFCVLNPDIELLENPFPKLLADLEHDRVGLCAPLILGADGLVEDSVRQFITPWRIFLRKLGLASSALQLKVGAKPVCPEWVAGMFMLFRAESYRKLGGFDETYFMYCEDADICTRLWLNGEQVLVDPEVSVVHQAQRASRRSWLHLRWHLASMARYFLSYWGRLPQTTRPL